MDVFSAVLAVSFPVVPYDCCQDIGTLVGPVLAVLPCRRTRLHWSMKTELNSVLPPYLLSSAVLQYLPGHVTRNWTTTHGHVTTTHAEATAL